MIAEAAVHTVGVNWTSVAVIIGGIGGVVIATMAFVIRLMDRRNNAIRDEITNAVTNLGHILEAKLETKDSVNQLRVELAELRGQVNKTQIPKGE
jgi:F0F1-type ATP synthase membrane subunit b/b'